MAIDTAAPYTKSSVWRMEAMIDALRTIDRNDIPGDIAECGVWRGGNIILARLVCPRRVCWLYDTFTGMTKATVFDHTRGFRRMDKIGKDAASVTQVKANLDDTGTYNAELLRFIEGPVEITLQNSDNLPARLALLRLDTDWYESTKAELEMLWPRLVPGGIMIIDDYGHWMGCKKAVDEYFDGQLPKMIEIDYSARMIVKQ